jgi:hypothetical protein
MDKTTTAVKKIVFNVRGKTLELTKDEAIELKEILADLFGGKETVYVDRWYHHWNHPYWTYTTNAIGNTYTPAYTSTTANTLYLSTTTNEGKTT